jgi:purine nucleosidase
MKPDVAVEALRVHLDTDFGGDTDDACALAMLLGWPGVEVVGITTTIDPGGVRAGYVAHCLQLVGREDIPLAAGSEVSLTTGKIADPQPANDRYWPSRSAPRPSRMQHALDLLEENLANGATVVGMGPYTNFALLEEARPGTLDDAPIVVMGGWVESPERGLPPWGPDMDFNVQWDTQAAEVLAAHADLTLATLSATMKAHLRAADLVRLRASGPLGELLARQGESHAEDDGLAELGPKYPGLPDDLLNFHYDPVACAVALGWPGAVVEEMRLKTVMDGQVLRFEPSEDGRLTRVVVDVDGDGFREVWLSAVEAAQQGAPK